MKVGIIYRDKKWMSVIYTIAISRYHKGWYEVVVYRPGISEAYSWSHNIGCKEMVLTDIFVEE